MLDFHSDIVEFYTYRSAIVAPKFFSIKLNAEQAKELKLFIENNGYHMDNHISFKLANGICVQYSDHKLYVSDEITIKNW